MAKCFLALFALSAVFAFPKTSSAQLDQLGYWENGISEPWWFSSADFNKEDTVTAVKLWHTIGEEIKQQQGGELGGTYFRGGETHGTFLRWSSKTGFVMANVDKCQARVMLLRYGRVEGSSTKIDFLPEFSKPGTPHSHSHSSSLNQLRFVPVKWRGSLMLVAEHEMSDFGDFVAGLGRYNYDDFLYFERHPFFTRTGDVREPNERTNPTPQVPPGYEHFLKLPITATITGVGKRIVKREYSYENPDGTGTSYNSTVSLTSVSIDAGSNSGLKKGMFLQVVDPNEQDRIRILSVDKSSSTGVIIRDVMEDGSEIFFDGISETPLVHSRIRAGWKLTTSHL